MQLEENATPFFTVGVSCFSSGTSRPLEDFRLSQFTWGRYKNNGILLTSEVNTRSRCGLQSIQKCPAQRSHQTDVPRWVPTPQMLHIYLTFISAPKFSHRHNSIWTTLCPLNTPTLHSDVSAWPTWPSLIISPRLLVLLALRFANSSQLCSNLVQFLNRSCMCTFFCNCKPCKDKRGQFWL